MNSGFILKTFIHVLYAHTEYFICKKTLHMKRQTLKTLPALSQVALYRRSYIRAHVLLNLLNELGKRNKMRGLPSILSLFRDQFNKFNKT